MATKRRGGGQRPPQGQRPRVQRRPAVPGGAGLPVTPRPAADAVDDVAAAAAEEPVAPPVPAPAPTPPPSTTATAAAAGSVGAPASPSASRRVGRVSGAPVRSRPGRPATAAAAVTANLDPEDASIPLAAVPYAAADLRRVGVIALLMTLLVVIAAVIVNTTVH